MERCEPHSEHECTIIKLFFCTYIFIYREVVLPSWFLSQKSVKLVQEVMRFSTEPSLSPSEGRTEFFRDSFGSISGRSARVRFPYSALVFILFLIASSYCYCPNMHGTVWRGSDRNRNPKVSSSHRSKSSQGLVLVQFVFY